ncbi:MAG: response regulator [Myxococcales bacterium]|nr:response regulator [Myxococcales bacterium]
MRQALIIDDSKTMRMMLRRSLNVAGVEDDRIAEAPNGQEGLVLARQLHPAVVLCDVNMPVLDGEGFLDGVLADTMLRDTPVFMVTSVANATQVLRLIRKGAMKVIRKPFDPTALGFEVAPFLREEQEAPAAPPPPEPDEYAMSLFAAMDEAVVEVLSTIAFLTAQRSTEGVPASRLLLLTEIPFRFAETPGLLRIGSTYDAATTIASNMAGGDVGIDDTARVDAISEFANMLVGEFLKKLQESAQSADDGVWFGLPQHDVAAPGRSNFGSPLSYELADAGGLIFVELVG